MCEGGSSAIARPSSCAPSLATFCGLHLQNRDLRGLTVPYWFLVVFIGPYRLGGQALTPQPLLELGLQFWAANLEQRLLRGRRRDTAVINGFAWRN